MNLLNPSTIYGALIIGIIAGLISGVILGFLSGRTYEKKVYKKARNITKGDSNITIQNSKLKGN